MHYLVIDLEATCDRNHEIPRDETEIIEIGAVVADASGHITREFQTFVKPTLHPITPFCTELTTITPEDVANAPDFAHAIRLLGRFMGRQPLTFCSWGAYDRNQFRRQARRRGLSSHGSRGTSTSRSASRPSRAVDAKASAAPSSGSG